MPLDAVRTSTRLTYWIRHSRRSAKQMRATGTASPSYADGNETCYPVCSCVSWAESGSTTAAYPATLTSNRWLALRHNDVRPPHPRTSPKKANICNFFLDTLFHLPRRRGINLIKLVSCNPRVAH